MAAAEVKLTGPSINRGSSSGDIWTPQVFINAVENRFGKLVWDLACTVDSIKAPRGYTFPEFDALTKDWHKIRDIVDVMGGPSPLLWLNCPYSNIAPWAKKCAVESLKGAEILLLVPMGGQNWYWDFVEPYAEVYSVGRMTFDNCYDKYGNLVTTPYPKDLILAHYDPRRADLSTLPKMQRWRWKATSTEESK